MMETTGTIGKRGFWELKKYREHEWFRFLIILLLLIAVVYLISHFFITESARYEYQKLGKEQLQQVNRIYFDTLADGKKEIDTLAIKQQNTKTSPAKVIDGLKCNRVILYIENEFNNKIDKRQIEKIRPYLCSSKPLEAIGFLSEIRFQVESYFWLVGPAVYFEIVFWAWFGVIASLLFSLGAISRNSTTDAENPQSVFDSSEIPSQFAKLFYAPLCTLVIVFGYNYFNEESIVDIGSSKGVIVFAFIGGFYSSRLIAFLDRLKELLLPHSGINESVPKKQNATIMMTNVIIDLQLDETTISAELRNEINEAGLSEASVTFENKENAEITGAVKTGEDQASTFVVASIKPGTYLVKATWSKEVNDQPLNLAAEKEVSITASDITINLVLLKDESDG